MREATSAVAQHSRRRRRQYRRGLVKLIATGTTLLDPARSAVTTLGTLLEELDAAALRTAVEVCTDRQRREERGDIDAWRARHPGLRRYLPGFFAPPLPGGPGGGPPGQGGWGGRRRASRTRQTPPSLRRTPPVPRTCL